MAKHIYWSQAGKQITDSHSTGFSKNIIKIVHVSMGKGDYKKCISCNRVLGLNKRKFCNFRRSSRYYTKVKSPRYFSDQGMEKYKIVVTVSRELADKLRSKATSKNKTLTKFVASILEKCV